MCGAFGLAAMHPPCTLDAPSQQCTLPAIPREQEELKRNFCFSVSVPLLSLFSCRAGGAQVQVPQGEHPVQGRRVLPSHARPEGPGEPARLVREAPQKAAQTAASCALRHRALKFLSVVAVGRGDGR